MFAFCSFFAVLSTFFTTASARDVYIEAVRLNHNGSGEEKNIGPAAFNKAFEACPVVQYTRNGEVVAVYKRVTTLPEDFDAYKVFTETWSNAPANELSTDFQLFDSHEAMLDHKEPWAFCNYNDSDVGFPRDCGKKGHVGNRWFSLPGGRHQSRGLNEGAALSVLRPKDCPKDVAKQAPSLIKNGSFSRGVEHWRELNHHPRANGLHPHSWANGHTTAHLHGFCTRSAGGMTQRIPTTVGQRYRLAFDAYSGNWDGEDTDVVQVWAGDVMDFISVSSDHHVNHGDPSLALAVELKFTAVSEQTNVSFYADVNHCIDVDNVVVTAVKGKKHRIKRKYRKRGDFSLEFPGQTKGQSVIAAHQTWRRKKAERLVLGLRKRGFSAYVVSLREEEDGPEAWLVYIGPFRPDQNADLLEEISRALQSDLRILEVKTLSR